MPSSIIQDITKKIVAQFNPVQIIVFGSFARGEEHKNSDLDLLVVMNSVQDRRRTAIEIRRALREFSISKDIIVTTPEQLRERSQVVGTVFRPAMLDGKVIYERN